MNQRLFEYVEAAVHDPALNEQYRGDLLPYMRTQFAPDLETYIKASRADKYRRYKVVNTVLNHISLLPFLDTDILDVFLGRFTETVCRTSFHRQALLYPENVEVFSFVETVDTIKQHYALLPLLLLDGFLRIATARISPTEIPDDDDGLAAVAAPSFDNRLFSRVLAASTSLTAKEKEREALTLTYNLRDNYLRAVLRSLGNPLNSLYEPAYMPRLNQLLNFRIFLSSLSNFFRNYTELDKINVCQGCHTLFYNVGRFAFSCSPTCNNRKKAKAFYDKRQRRKKLAYSPRAYNFLDD